jgi:hypothetical protein
MSVKTVGGLWLIGGALLLLIGIAAILSDPEIFALIDLLVGSFVAWTGWLTRTLQPRARVPATILSIVGLAAFPIGTAISGYMLYLLWSTKGSMIFSDQYGLIVRATPHVRYKTSPLVLAVAGALLLLILAGLILPTILN